MGQGIIHGVKSIDTISFSKPSKVLTDQKVTYASFVCDHRLLKTEPWLIRLVVGREKFRNMKIQVLQFQI